MALTPDDEERLKQSRKGRNVALALVLFALVVLFYAITIVKVSG